MPDDRQLNQDKVFIDFIFLKKADERRWIFIQIGLDLCNASHNLKILMLKTTI